MEKKMKRGLVFLIICFTCLCISSCDVKENQDEYSAKYFEDNFLLVKVPNSLLEQQVVSRSLDNPEQIQKADADIARFLEDVQRKNPDRSIAVEMGDMIITITTEDIIHENEKE